ncbi:type II toxin-antitoxin system RelE/ParE family toxin [Neisseria iguanae]|uniref:Type II toxin-antitoxin system RelE/ParE family toxin n=1 Tax=Neisseria iguanae TaxID=90242 RepID=A0A2P7U2M6_9NEIS|nr:type II toxin-antitoxin system RelE/ParE family toxin [Neisseria iguanae]PSJ81228.1 type II toxin-antitoxin system RelE/ParE family toxin [Neisseria iguanae]
MPQIILTENAAADLQRLYLFLEEKDILAARRAIQTIRETLNKLAAFPAGGRFFDDDYREWPVPFGNWGYLVLYRIEPEAVIIVAIKHQRESAYSGVGVN